MIVSEEFQLMTMRGVKGIMKLVGKSFPILFALFMWSTTAIAEEWHGIVPLHSTREDVKRLLGDAYDENDIRAKYSFDKEDVYIVWSGETFSQECVRQLPVGTILLIQVRPKINLSLSDIHMDKMSFVTFDPSSPSNIGYKGYFNEERGIVIRTLNDRIDQVDYIASSQDLYICPEYYREPKGFVRILIDFFDRDTSVHKQRKKPKL